MRSTSRRSRVWLWPVAIAAALALVVGAIVASEGDEGDEDDGDGATGAPSEILHVHGLGRNPENDQLYVATHFGLFTIESDGTTERVGTSAQDDMGFTVIGPDRFLASGHPDFAQHADAHPLMGLIESTDGGLTWETRSLEGEADFHALAAVHDQIYGWNASTGAFMVSHDGSVWERRSELSLVSFAVDPTDPQHLVGSSDDAFLTSDDGGRTWQRAEGPAASYLSWDDDELWAAGLDGVVQVSDDEGRTWQLRAPLLSGAAALLADGGTLYAATDTAAILVSADGAESWTSLIRS